MPVIVCCSPARPISSSSSKTARQELKLASAIEKLDKYHLLVLDDLSYVQKSQAETSVIFELISARYERRSLLITANQPFGAWDSIFPDPAMTVAAIDRLVHHSIILEMNTDSYRRKSAEMKLRRKAPGSAAKATRRSRPPRPGYRNVTLRSRNHAPQTDR